MGDSPVYVVRMWGMLNKDPNVYPARNRPAVERMIHKQSREMFTGSKLCPDQCSGCLWTPVTYEKIWNDTKISITLA
jgi:hypothetical protein